MKSSKPIGQLMECTELVNLAFNLMSDESIYFEFFEDFNKVFDLDPVLINAIDCLCERYHKYQVAFEAAKKSSFRFDDIISVINCLKTENKNEVA